MLETLHDKFIKQTPTIVGCGTKEHLATYCEWLIYQLEYKYKYTEEDIINAYNQGGNDGANYQSMLSSESTKEECQEADEFSRKMEEHFIESLNQPKELEFEMESYLNRFSKDSISNWVKD
jgi:hypothetical protein